MSSVVASIQARMGSSRLPGKVLKPICNKPLLSYQIERIRRSRLVDDVIVATSTNPLDDAIEKFCREKGVKCYRGPEDDVLGRVAGLIGQNKVDIHVEAFGDSPLIDPQIVDEFVGYFLKNRSSVDYVSNTLKTTYPPGLEVIVYSGESLLKINQKVDKNDPLREHCGYNLTRFQSDVRIASLEAPEWIRYPEIFLEVDTAEDFEVMTEIISHFENENIRHYSALQIIEYAKSNSELFLRNIEVERRWKQFRT